MTTASETDAVALTPSRSPSAPESPAPSETEDVARLRRKVLRFSGRWSIGLIFAACILCAAICAMYLDIVWEPYKRLDRLTVAVVNGDIGYLGGRLNLGVQIKEGMIASRLFEFRRMPNSTTLAELEHMVVHDKVWSGIYIPANFSYAFARAFYGLGAPGEEYDNAVTIVQDPTKQYSTNGAAEQAVKAVLQAVSKGLQKAMHEGKLGQKGANAPAGVLWKPVAVNTRSIHPVEVTGWYMSTYLPYTFLWTTVSIAARITIIAFHSGMSKLVPTPVPAVVALRYGGTLAVACVVSGTVTGILKHWGLPAAHGYSSVWGLLWLCSFSFAGILHTLWVWVGDFATTVSVAVIYLMILTAGALYQIDTLSPGWARTGPILPLSHAVDLMRYAAFDALPENHGKHIAVLFAWGFGGIILTTIGLYLIPRMGKFIKAKRGERLAKAVRKNDQTLTS